MSPKGLADSFPVLVWPRLLAELGTVGLLGSLFTYFEPLCCRLRLRTKWSFMGENVFARAPSVVLVHKAAEQGRERTALARLPTASMKLAALKTRSFRLPCTHFLRGTTNVHEGSQRGEFSMYGSCELERQVTSCNHTGT